MPESRITEGAVALKLLCLVIEVMVRRRLLGRSDLEHMIARLSMEAHRQAPAQDARICEAAAEQVRSWLLAAGDELPDSRPTLALVKRDDED